MQKANICRVVENCSRPGGIMDMEIYGKGIGENAAPGRFIHIKCGGMPLRRPISIAGISPNSLRICYEIKGEGTRILSEMKPGDEVDFIGPVGNGFSIPKKGSRAVLVGGGIGIFPLLPAAGMFETPAAILGFRDGGNISFADDFTAAGCDVMIATEDGSAGEKGLVTDLLAKRLDAGPCDVILTCGPKAMMKAVAGMAAERGIRCEVSLEERMACGIGACLVCACAMKSATGEKDYRRVCKDGPVFDASEVDFSE